jgi:hypothetical protein
MPENKKIYLKREILLVAVILSVAALGLIFNYIRQKKPATIVEISIDGTVVNTLDLNKDTEITINGYQNGTNHLVIKDGQVWIDDASCPDKVCIHQGKISKNSEAIVCLPNLMIAHIRDAEN